MMYLDIPLTYVAQWIGFGEGISLVELCGVLVLMCGIIGTSIEKLMQMRQRRLTFIRSDKSSIIA